MKPGLERGFLRVNEWRIREALCTTQCVSEAGRSSAFNLLLDSHISAVTFSLHLNSPGGAAAPARLLRPVQPGKYVTRYKHTVSRASCFLLHHLLPMHQPQTRNDVKFTSENLLH